MYATIFVVIPKDTSIPLDVSMAWCQDILSPLGLYWNENFSKVSFLTLWQMVASLSQYPAFPIPQFLLFLIPGIDHYFKHFINPFIGLPALSQSTSQQLECKLNENKFDFHMFYSLLKAQYLIKPLNITGFNKYSFNKWFTPPSILNLYG